ncbi:MAG: amidohydrolase family protein [Deltaproteobacteria bacterium]|nr:amidohydrolase family protein [Deltaproteobacteria bacterium]MBW2665209.1 amidohydrolase family protein [Deltaproteobacteria bacterium]
MLDCLIRGGTIIDGTGVPGVRAEVGIRDGRIVAVGAVEEDARQVLDAAGKVVAPGFVDIHTHYDAQAFWDPMLSPSPLHGVTTVFGGNCGFSVAPLSEEAGGYLCEMLARVEGMPLEALQAGVPWDWSSFEEYLSRFDGRLGVNAGFLVGHSTLRRVVMGPDAVGKQATNEQIEAMCALLRESLAAGGMGFSSSNAPTHNDNAGNPVPSRFATRDEIVALAGVLADFPGTQLEFIPTVGFFEEEHKALMTDMSVAANRPLNWNVLGVAAFNPELAKNQLGASDYAAERGGRIVALTPSQVMSLRINLRSGFIFDALPGWAEVLALPIEARKQALADPEVRRRLDAGANSDEAGVLRAIAVWQNMTVNTTFLPENNAYEGRRVGEIAAELGKKPFDTLLDLALSEDLKTSFTPFIPGDDDDSWKLRGEIWQDDRTVVGASDAGAHLDMIDTFSYSTSLLGPGVREKGLLSLEAAIQQLTDVPARLYGVRDRGRIAEGWWADIVIFDPESVGAGSVHFRDDLPTGASRLYAEADGIAHVLVNGVEIVRGREFTGATPGTVMRSGRDTETVRVHD